MEYGLICSLVVGAAIPMILRQNASVEANLYEMIELLSSVI
jgi:hypothetical protein